MYSDNLDRLNKQNKALNTEIIHWICHFFKDKGISISFNLEIEGVIKHSNQQHINFEQLNKTRQELGIQGQFKPEFWKNQWEFETTFGIGNVSSTLQNYTRFINNLNTLFYPLKPLLIPVAYQFETGEIAKQNTNIFVNTSKVIHIPNAIQVNISLWKEKQNLLANKAFAYHLQNKLIKNSVSNLLFSIPNQRALDRLHLTSSYNLSQELCSPHNISGGHTGSIAYYAETNKKNSPLNPDHIILNQHGKMEFFRNNWQEKARIEYRLASSCLDYNIYNHCSFILLNCLSSYFSFRQSPQKSNPKVYAISKTFNGKHPSSIVNQFRKSKFLSSWVQQHVNDFNHKNKTVFIKSLDQLQQNILNRYTL